MWYSTVTYHHEFISDYDSDTYGMKLEQRGLDSVIRVYHANRNNKLLYSRGKTSFSVLDKIMILLLIMKYHIVINPTQYYFLV